MRSSEWFCEVLTKMQALQKDDKIMVEGTSTELARLKAFIENHLRQGKNFRQFRIVGRENILIIYKLGLLERTPRRLMRRYNK
jgi:hypothetical protein